MAAPSILLLTQSDVEMIHDSFRHSRFGFLAGFLACIVPFCFASEARGQATYLGQLPGKRRAADFTMSISIEAIGGNGYQPVRLSFKPNKKVFSRDHSVSVMVRPKRNYGSGLDFSLYQSIVLPQGSATEELDLNVPYYFTWDNLHVQLLEDGRPIESGQGAYPLHDRNKFVGQHVSVGIITGEGSGPAWEKCPDVRTLNTVLGDGPMPSDHHVDRLNHASATNLIQKTQPAWVQYRLMDEFLDYKSWLAYSQLDVIIVAAPVLGRIRDNKPDTFAALEKWIAAGGNLWIYAADEQADFFDGKLKSVSISDKRFVRQTNKKNSSFPSMNRLRLNEINDDSPIETDYYREPTKQSARMGNSGFMMRRDVFKELKDSKHPFAKRVAWTDIKKRLAVHSLGLGRVVQMKDEDPFPGSFQFWESVKLVSGNRLAWPNRFGVDVANGNDRFWSWLIPSVGKPPVKSFVFLNILFAAIVGPLCYFFLRRRDRLYLLYFAAPALAFLVTASLFAYAIGSDGLSTKVRARQVTWLDQGSDLAVRQSLQTYYAVIGQSEGLGFSSDTSVSPVSHFPIMSYSYRSRADREGAITVDDTGQVMTGDFLPPRNQVQYSTTTPFRTNQKVTFEFVSANALVKNDSLYAINRIVARDVDGRYWEASKVLPGKSAKLSPTDRPGLQSFLQPHLLPNPSQFFVPELQRSKYYGRTKPVGMETNLLEQRLHQWGRGSMPKQSFVATADLDRGALGVVDAKVLDSVHLVMGDIP